MASQPEFAAAWLSQRDAGVRAIEEIEARELRELTIDEALRLADALLGATPVSMVADERVATSGFVEQQRRFGRLRR